MPIFYPKLIKNKLSEACSLLINSSSLRKMHLFQAIEDGNIKKARRMAKNKNVLNLKRVDGVTPLILACSLGHTKIAQMLISLGADPTIATPEGWIAYDFAHSQGNSKLQKVLFKSEKLVSQSKECCTNNICDDLTNFVDNMELILPKNGFAQFSKNLEQDLGLAQANEAQEELKKTNYRALFTALYSVEALSCAHFAQKNYLKMHSPMSIGAYDIPMAKRRNIDLVEYYQQKFDITNQFLFDLLPDEIFERNPERICEVGGAWGATIKHFMDRFSINEYQNYELDTFYAQWAVERFGVKKMPVDGETLSATEDKSMDLVIANNVLIFVPPIKIWSYLIEMRRVIKKGGLIIFNAVISDQLTEEDLKNYLDACFPKRSICILPRDFIDKAFPKPQFEILKIVGKEYFVIKKVED